MWYVSPTPTRPYPFLFPRQIKLLTPIALAVPPSSRPPSHSSSPQQRQNQEGGGGETGQQLRGVDVLWAMERAAAEKQKASAVRGGKRNKKRRNLSPSIGQMKEDAVDYSNVRPLCVKSEWGARLDELESRLKELSETA